MFGDRASGFIQGEKLKGTKTKDIIGALDRYINRYAGPMYVLISDGGPQYQETNRMLEEYCKHAGIIHRTSSALNPESNGFTESAVCTLKAQVRKATQGKVDWERALTINNAMQRPDKSGSPSEIFFRGM